GRLLVSAAVSRVEAGSFEPDGGCGPDAGQLAAAGLVVGGPLVGHPLADFDCLSTLLTAEKVGGHDELSFGWDRWDCPRRAVSVNRREARTLQPGSSGAVPQPRVELAHQLGDSAAASWW